MKNITLEGLKDNSACRDGATWFTSQKEKDLKKVILKLGKERRYDWADWVLGRVLTKKQSVQYAIFAAEQVLAIYEQKFPGDNQPRATIEAAKAWINSSTEGNKDAAYVATYAVYTTYATNAASNYDDLRMRILTYTVSLIETPKKRAVKKQRVSR